eukprot:XP_011604164.1 PREDICTED: zinc finger CCCH domain-containing protein 13-like isoform X1 [Takifugu rubripes]
MGAKRPSGTVFDTLSTVNTSDRKFQPGGKVSLDPSPRPAMSAKLEKGRDVSHEEGWRREREMEKARDKGTYRDHGPRDRYYERHRGPVPRQREWSERERWQENERRQNMRPLSSVEKETERYAARGMNKGDTFPRMTKNSGDRGGRVKGKNDGSGEQRRRDRPKGLDADDWEREYEREQQREGCRVKDREEMSGRLKEEGPRRRERDDSWERRERDTARKREKPRSDMGKREPRVASPYRQRDRDIYSDRVERDATHRRQGQRDTRSEGDSDEREMRKERDKERDREYHHSRSDGDGRDKPKRDRYRDRQGYRDEDKYRYRDRDREREVDRSRRRDEERDRERYREDRRSVAWEAEREGERWKDSNRDLKGDRRRHDVSREPKQEIYRERKEKEEDHRREDSTGRDGRAQSDTTPRAPPRAQSSGEWSSTDVDEQRTAGGDDDRRRREQDRHRRGKTEQRRMWLEPQRGINSRGNIVDEGTSTSERNIESLGEWGRGEQRVKEEPDEVYSDQRRHTERYRSRNEQSGNTKTEGVSVDGEMYEVWREKDKEEREQMSGSHRGADRRQDVERENMMEESDRDGGSDYWARSESEGGSDTDCKQEKDKMLSGEDDFVTISSGGDEQEEREEDEEQYEDCQEYLEGGDKDHSPGDFVGHDGDKETEQEWTTGKEETVDEDDQASGKQPQYVFCVIGQTLPREKAIKKTPPEVDRSPEEDGPGEPNTKWRDQGAQRASAQEAEVNTNLEAEDRTRGKVLTQADLGPITRDSLTERLLTEWRQKNNIPSETESEHSLQVPDNPYGDVYSKVDFEQIQPILEELGSGTMSPDEVEAIRIRLSGAWTLSEEPKQPSQAPHLKWAKNVVQEILGNSEEGTVDEISVETDGDRRVNQSENTSNNVKQQVETTREPGEVPLDLRMDAQHSDAELDMDESLELEGLRGRGQSRDDMHAEQVTAMHGDARTYTHTDTQLHTGGKEEHSMDKENRSPPGHHQPEKVDIMVETCEKSGDCEISETEKSRREEVEMYLSVSNTLYKPSSCPILICEAESETLVPSSEGEDKKVGQDRTGESEEDGQEEERDIAEGMVGSKGEEGNEPDEHVSDQNIKGATLASSYSFRDLGPKARLRRLGVRKTTERKDGEHVEVKEEEGAGRDRRTRIFSTTDDDDDRSRSWEEVELRNVLDTIQRRKRNSRFFNAAQLYQQYNEAAQNFEILRQARSDGTTVSEDTTPSLAPSPSPPPARRPLPPLPSAQTPHRFSHTGSITSVQSLPLPEPPKIEGRPPSPRLSISLSKSSSLWRELPGVRNSSELEELTEDQRRLQEVRFEVVTSEASYCRSLDIVVEHFVKSKQLGALLGTQDRNWLFSRLADVRAISHSFLSKLEERVESNLMSFTVCDIIAKHCQRFKMVYVPYLTNQSYQDATYQRLMNENPGFRRIVEKLEQSVVCQRLPLRSFLVLPFQRITRLKLLVQNIVKRTTPGTTEATQAIKALKLLAKLIQESNDSITQMKSIESLVSLSAKVDFECRTLPLISQSRRMIREGPVTELMDFSLKDTERSVYLHLFNDYLLLSLQKEGGRFTVVDHSPVSVLRVENCRVKLHSLQKNLFRVHMSTKALLLRTDALSDKLRWISALSRPHPEIDFSAAQDFPQMQCIRAFVAQQPDELSLEKADIILVHQQSTDHWVEGTRLSDRHRGWLPASHLETITNSRVRQHNLEDALKVSTATAAV